MDKLVIKKMNSERFQIILISIISQILIVCYCVTGILLSEFGYLTKNYNALGYIYLLLVISVVIGVGVILLALFAQMNRPVDADKNAHKTSMTKTKIIVNIIAFIVFIVAIVLCAVFANKYETMGLKSADIAYGVFGIAIFAVIITINFIVDKAINRHKQKKNLNQ